MTSQLTALYVVGAIVGAVCALAVLADMLRISWRKFDLAGSSKFRWVLGPVMLYFLFFVPAMLLAAYWFLRARPRVLAVSDSIVKETKHQESQAVAKAISLTCN